jgi:hypothetical protein
MRHSWLSVVGRLQLRAVLEQEEPPPPGGLWGSAMRRDYAEAVILDQPRLAF